ncbi:MAG TPA: hypothetical protein VES95_08045 [Dermatophilaceae bacterium]|nr:hypothetical protein [Dermatophilaceae bacterium]
MYRRRIQQIRRTAHEVGVHEDRRRGREHVEHERQQAMIRAHLR